MAHGFENGSYRADLAATTGAAGALALLNPEGVDLYVTRLVLNISTAATAACTLDAGIAATATTDDDLIDGLDVNTAAGVFDNVKNGGTNGKAGQKWAAGSYLTVSEKTGAIAGLVGEAIIQWVRL